MIIHPNKHLASCTSQLSINHVNRLQVGCPGIKGGEGREGGQLRRQGEIRKGITKGGKGRERRRQEEAGKRREGKGN